MILILSTTSDINTNEVIEWLRHFNTPFLRINDEDVVSGDIELCYNLKDGSFEIKGISTVKLKEIKIVWFRKFGFLTSHDNFFKKYDSASNLLSYTYSEFDKFRKLLLALLNDKKWLYNRNNMLTKLEILKFAHKNNLKIPKTIVANNKAQLVKNFSKNEDIVIKPMGEAKNIYYLNSMTPLLTQKIKIKDIKCDKFSPSLFQKYIKKKFELRIFYLNEQFFSMAMFTQKNSKTSVDFRNYDRNNPPRRVPYNLPKEIELRLNNLMLELGINTGSIDMICTEKKEFVFLEVNPTGQFGMTEVPCNYPIHYEIAKYLTNSIYN